MLPDWSSHMPDMKRGFYEYFRESMDSVGLPAPESLWGAAGTAAATLNALLSAIGSVGSKATIGELIIAAEAGIGAGASIAVAKGVLVGLSGVMASYYVGACVGAFIYATEMTLVEKF